MLCQLFKELLYTYMHTQSIQWWNKILWLTIMYDYTLPMGRHMYIHATWYENNYAIVGLAYNRLMAMNFIHCACVDWGVCVCVYFST